MLRANLQCDTQMTSIYNVMYNICICSPFHICLRVIAEYVMRCDIVLQFEAILPQSYRLS